MSLDHEHLYNYSYKSNSIIHIMALAIPTSQHQHSILKLQSRLLQDRKDEFQGLVVNFSTSSIQESHHLFQEERLIGLESHNRTSAGSTTQDECCQG